MTGTIVTLKEILPPDYQIEDYQNVTFDTTSIWLRRATEIVFNFDVAQRYPKTLRALALLRGESIDQPGSRLLRDAFEWLRGGAFAVRLPAVYDGEVVDELRKMSWADGVRRMNEDCRREFVGDRSMALKALVERLRRL